MIKKRYPGADIKLYSSSSYLKCVFERDTQHMFKKGKMQFDINAKKYFSECIKQF